MIRLLVPGAASGRATVSGARLHYLVHVLRLRVGDELEVFDGEGRAFDAKVAALARVFSWGVDRGHITNNPLATFERAYSAERAEMIWLPEHVTAFEAVAAPELRLALMLALHTGKLRVSYCFLRIIWCTSFVR